MDRDHETPMHVRVVLASAVALGLVACAPAAGGDAEFWTPLFGAGGAATTTSTTTVTTTGTGGQAMTTTTTTTGSGGGTMTGGTGGSPPVGPADGELDVAFTTVSFGGKYAPKNVVAVWVTDDQDAFVKTLGVFATKRIKYLVTWLGASNGNTVDAVTGATFGAHGTHAVTWDSKDAQGNVAPDGNYRVYIEFTEQNKLGKFMFVPFTKGHSAFDSSPPNQPYFEDVHVVYTP